MEYKWSCVEKTLDNHSIEESLKGNASQFSCNLEIDYIFVDMVGYAIRVYSI